MSVTESRTPARAVASTRLPVLIGGLGAAVPPTTVTNFDLARQVDTSDEWIIERTGIRERRRLAAGLGTSDLAIAAARRAMADAGAAAGEIDLLIVCTCSPDQPLPSTAAYVARDLGTRGAAMDLTAACSGWVYGLVTASSLLATGTGRAALVIGAEVLSRWLDPEDRTTLPLFGDGAAAAVIRAPDGGAGQGGRDAADCPGLIAWDLGCDGAGADLLRVEAGGSRLPITPEVLAGRRHRLAMDGREVFRRAVRAVESSCQRTLAVAGIDAADVDVFVPHQANARIVDAILPRLGIEPERTVVNIDRYGNTSSASIPLALSEATAAGRIADGDLVLLCGFGAGMTWGTALIRWGYTGTGPRSPELRP